MKKFFLSLAVVLIAAFSASAQVKSDAAINKAIDKAKAATENPKKAAKPATWIKLAKAYEAAYSNPTANVLPGMGEQDLLLTMGNDKPLSEEMVTIGGVQYKKKVYERKNIYFDPATGGIALMEVTKPSFAGDALLEAYNAYVKAYEVDAKHKNDKAIAEAFVRISDHYYDDALTAYYLGDYARASAFFAMSSLVSRTAPCTLPKDDALFNAGVSAQKGTDLARAQKLYLESLQAGYAADGNAYSNLAEIALVQKDTVSARKTLEDGFVLYPTNPSILANLINIYLRTNEDPRLILDKLEAAKAMMPDNTSLYVVQGDLLVKLGEEEEALAAYRHIQEMDANDPIGLYSEGLFWFNKALAIQAEANDLPYNEYRQYDALIEKMHQVLITGLAPFEKSVKVAEGNAAYDDVRISAMEHLKQMYFTLRNDDPKYNEAYKQMEEALAK